MAQENKELLLKDLSARLSYGIKVLNTAEDLNEICKLDSVMTTRSGKDCFVGLTLPDDSIMTGIEMVKPYLRPMSSMTKEEREELRQISEEYLDDWSTADSNLLKWKLDAKVSSMTATFYNSHHLDWNGLIEKGLAIEAPEGMYDMIKGE